MPSLHLPSLLRALNSRPPNTTVLSSFSLGRLWVIPVCKQASPFPPPTRVSATPFSTVVRMTAVPENSSISPSKRFWIKSSREAMFAVYSPFVVCLASGTLEADVFRGYIAQDAHFLKAFAHAYEMAEQCVAADDDYDAKIVISDLKNAVLEELKIHNSVAQDCGIDITKEIAPNSITVKYTNFLQAITLGEADGIKTLNKIATSFEKTKVAAYIIGAMTPCLRLYAFLGQKLQAILQSDAYSGHPYKDWIATYSAISFETSAIQIEELLDKLCFSLTEEELQIAEKLYSQAMRLEVEFFYAQPIIQQTAAPLIGLEKKLENHFVIFSDFDLTCTIVDSCAILAEFAILTAAKNDQSDTHCPNFPKSSTDLRNLWNVLSEQYSEEYEQCIENILKSGEAKGFNYEGLFKALETFSEFEKMSNMRVIESELLKGLKLDDIKRKGECLTFHNGCTDFFQKITTKEKLKVDLHILSVCWCGDLIRAAFAAGGLGCLNAHSNDLCYEDSVSTGAFLKKMQSPLDKVEAFKRILNSKQGTNDLSIYIGDSIGDLLCLLEADIGIVIGSNSNLRIVGLHFGVSFEPLFHGLVNKQRQLAEGVRGWKGSSGTLYTVSNWAEIHAFILGIY